ncbi:MAG: hypothetical protein IH571_03810 [Acholeplasmataceae bacterium]|nr:hypothetical protein [Acholeplasmataceae bacterium]
MADKYTKVDPRIHPLTIASVVAFFVIIFGIIVFTTPSNEQKIYNAYTLVATNDFTEEHPFYEVNYKSGFLGLNRGLTKILEKEEVVFLYIGDETCESCQLHIGAFQKYFYSEGVDEVVEHIYYFNPLMDTQSFDLLRAAYPSITATTPQIIVFKNGEYLNRFAPGSATTTQAINSSVKNFFLDTLGMLE